MIEKISLSEMNLPQLLDYFQEICEAQSRAKFSFQSTKYNKLYDTMMLVRKELGVRGKRAALEPLYQHKDPQVRYQAAMATLVVLPMEAKAVLQRISDRDEYPQAIDARMILKGLNNGSFKPS